MKLTNGGVVERNEVLFHDDRVIILLKDDIIPLVLSQSGIKSELVTAVTSAQANHNNPETCVKKETDAANQALLEAINNIHLKDFHQIFRTFRDKEE